MDRMVEYNVGVEDGTPESDFEASPALESVPPTPGLNMAIIETPRVDLTPRALRRKPFRKVGAARREWLFGTW